MRLLGLRNAKMGKKTLTALVAAALVGITTLTLAVPADAGQGRGYGRGGGWGGGGRYVQNNYYGGGYRHGGGNGWNAVGAGLLGFGVGAIVGSALTPQTVVVAPPPPPPAPAYAPVAYGPPAWTPDWYTYCYSRYRTFNAQTGTFIGYDGYQHFCR
jgi:hypothetical protein